jgi:iron(III) transport system permease protein
MPTAASSPAAASARPPRAGRWILVGGVVVVSLLALAPLLSLLGGALLGEGPGGLALGVDGVEQMRGTLMLVAGEGMLGALLGTAIGWLTAVCRFPGRRWLRIAQLVPMAFPAYLLAASLIDWASYRGLRIHGLGWAVLLLTLANYSYVFLLSTESFSVSGRRLLEASRSLGWGPGPASFGWRSPLPCPPSALVWPSAPWRW